MSDPQESKVDVLIIGAGPAGLMACHALKKHGVDVRIIDQRGDKVAAGQADGLQPRTLEILQSYGLAERMMKDGAQLHTVAFYNPTSEGGIELTDRVADITAPTARYPYEVTLHQGEIEATFLDSLSGLGAKVERPIIPSSITLDHEKVEDPEAYPVEVVLQHSGKNSRSDTEIVHAKYVIGADGAHSWVRKTLGIKLVGEQTNYIWGVIDFVPDTDFPDIRNRTAIHSNNGSCMVIPREGDKIRLYIQLDGQSASAFLSNDGKVDKTKVTPEKLLNIARKSFYPYTIETPDEFEWYTLYIIGQRVASQYSVEERIFIVGDACHTHSPKAGQGMNASMSDSHNLAWKISHVLKGWADRTLLKTYQFERQKYAQDLIDFDKKFASLFSGKPQTESQKDGVSHEAFLETFQTFGGFTSGIGIHYADSPITQSYTQNAAKKLVVGQRLLPQIFMRAADTRPVEIQDMCPADGRFKILVFTGDSSDLDTLPRVDSVAQELENLFSRLSGGSIFSLFDILSISAAKKRVVRYNILPPLLRSHWTKALIDDTDAVGRSGGNGYHNYGIDLTEGAIVVVRPDGYVGVVSGLSCVTPIASYFNSFMCRT